MKNKNNKGTPSTVTLSARHPFGGSTSPTKPFRRGVEAQKEKTDKSAALITRKEALIKTSKYVAYTALATFIILNPKKAQAQSTPDNPGY
jgi:hypothetical protein